MKEDSLAARLSLAGIKDQKDMLRLQKTFSEMAERGTRMQRFALEHFDAEVVPLNLSFHIVNRLDGLGEESDDHQGVYS